MTKRPNSFLNAFFGPTPKKGETWKYNIYNPFCEWTVQILEVKDGWVKYSMGPYSMFQNEQCRILQFRWVYYKP